VEALPCVDLSAPGFRRRAATLYFVLSVSKRCLACFVFVGRLPYTDPSAPTFAAPALRISAFAVSSAVADRTVTATPVFAGALLAAPSFRGLILWRDAPQDSSPRQHQKCRGHLPTCVADIPYTPSICFNATAMLASLRRCNRTVHVHFNERRNRSERNACRRRIPGRQPSGLPCLSRPPHASRPAPKGFCKGGNAGHQATFALRKWAEKSRQISNFYPGH